MNYRLVHKLSLSYLAATLVPLMANPIDPTPTVVTGQVEFAGLDTHSAVITQGSQMAIVDYSHFNIPEGSSVQFIQPNAESSLLNRISGADPSVLNGSLTANGQIYFVNPAGVTFGRNSVIRADVFMAAAGQISNADFLNNIQNFSLTGNIINHGSIQTENGVGLFGQQVENTGEIVARNGYAIVASGDEVHVRQGGTGLAVDVTDSARATEAGTGIKNLGTVDGEDVMFSAGDAFATAIQQSGKVTARRSAKVHSDGGKIEVSGEITARDHEGQGGRIEVGGTDLGADTAPSSSSTEIASSAVLDASSQSGKGGHIVVWSDGHTDFSGVADATSLSGEGGFIEASGKTIEFSSISDNILLGTGGHFLLDPEDITIDATYAGDIEVRLDNGELVSIITNSADPGNGDITVTASIIVPINNGGRKGTLNLVADRDIIISDGITVQNVQQDFLPGETVFDLQAGRNITINGDLRHSGTNAETGQGSILLTAAGDVLVNDITVDANGGSIVINADQVTVSGLSGNLVSGFDGAGTGRIDITATSGFTLEGGGLIQTFDSADIFINTALFRNSTGLNGIRRANLSESFYAIKLPNPTGDGIGGAHLYNGLSSGSRALFNVTDFSAIKSSGITQNRFYYTFQPTINITANGGSKIYGNTFNLPTGAPAVTVDPGGFVGGFGQNPPFVADTIANINLSGITTASAGAIISADVASYPITATGATSDNGYAFNYLPGALVVNPRLISITANQQSKQYGDVLQLANTPALPSPAFIVTDFDDDNTLPNGNAISAIAVNSPGAIDASTTAIVGTYSDEIQITGQTGSGGFNPANYTIEYIPGDLVVNRREVTLTASQQNKFYGDQLDLTSNASATAFTILDNGLTDYGTNPAGDSNLPNGETITTVSLQSVGPINIARSTTDSVNTYPGVLQINGVNGDNLFDVNNYDLTFINGDIVIDRRPITVTPADQSKQYGEILPLGTTAFTVLDQGLTDLDSNPATLPNSERITSVTLLSSSGLAAKTDQDVGSYVDNISVDAAGFTSSNGTNGFNLGNYDITFGTGDLTINARQIELIASRQEKFYGDALVLDNTAFTVVDQGRALDNALPNGEVVTSVTINSVNAFDSSLDVDAGLYSNEINIGSPVTGTPGTGDGFLESNYEITFTSGDLLVKPRPITVAAVGQEKIYGNTLILDPTAFTITDLNGGALLPNGEMIDTVNVISRGGHDLSTTSPARTYVDDLEVTSVATSSLGFDLANYSIDFSNLADFVINRRAVTLTALQQQKDYGDVHILGGTAFRVTDLDNDSDLPNGETVDLVTLVSAGGIDASTDADVATYAGNISITPTTTGQPTLSGSPNFDQENYLFSYETGDFVINRRAITLAASTQEKIYGNELVLDDTAFTTQDRDGGSTLPNGEVVTNVTINSVNAFDSSLDVDAGLYSNEINIGSPVTGTPGTGDGFLESNYDITYVAGDLIVNKRGIILTARPQSKVYGESIPTDPLAFTVQDLNGGSALPNNETINSVNITSNVAEDSTANVGVYGDDLVPTNILSASPGFNESNYDITRVNGNYTVDKRAILITALDQGKIYGEIDSLDPTSFSVTDTYGGGGSALPNNELVNTVSFNPTTRPEDTTAPAALYSDELAISGQVGSNGFDAANYEISYAAGDYTIARRAIELVINDDKRFAGAAYQIDPTAFVTIDLDGDEFLPNSETVDSLVITSLTGVAEDPAAPMGIYDGELVADPLSAIGSNGFSLDNYTITVTPGGFEIEAFPGLAAISQDIFMERWILDNIGLNPLDPFANSYAISQSLGLRILSLESWASLSSAKKQAVLSALDDIPLHLQTLNLAQKLIEKVK